MASPRESKTRQRNGSEAPKDDEEQPDFDALQKEMELAQYAKRQSGNLVRRVPRDQRLERTRKRRILEAQDDEEMLEEGPSIRRLRGARAAQEDEVIQGSQVFPSMRRSGGREAEDEQLAEDSDEVIVGELSDEEMVNGVESDSDAIADDDELEDEYDYEDDGGDEEYDGDDDDEEEEPNEEGGPEKGKLTATAKVIQRSRQTGKPSRRMYRLKNFRSIRMAQRHGDALGAHARGLQKVAIFKLKQVAKDAPSAPQVYSSLGMVYEDMLREKQRKLRGEIEDDQAPKGPVEQAGSPDDDVDVDDVFLDDEITPDSDLAEQLKIAKKAYGSYHVAALLCKKDYSLWVRAADAASDIVQLHTKVMLLPSIADEVREYHRSEKARWFSEAKNDYQSADNLKPPGIDVPAKLAELLGELGNISEALTVLTDLKNRPPETPGDLSDFEKSYRAWMLYADLMLRIGFECQEWNSGNHSNENYMFRRWLRKFSTSFDWQERRLQALGRALEAAAGSESCSKLMEWMYARAKTLQGNTNAPGEPSEAIGTMGDNHTNEHSVDIPKADQSQEATDGPEAFEREREFLVKRCRTELEEFDKTTKDIATDRNDAIKERATAREALRKKHKDVLVHHAASYHKKRSATSSNVRAFDLDTNRQRTGLESRVKLPLSASCQNVCAIAGELMRHLLGMDLFTGGRLVGEATSSYFKLRASSIDEKKKAKRRFGESQNMTTYAFALNQESYDTIDHHSDGEESVISEVLLSDEGELGEEESASVLGSLRAGILPPQLKFYYGICLAGEGGKEFLSLACLRAANELEQEPVHWLREKPIDTSVVANSRWLHFHHGAREPLRRTCAYSMLGGFLRNGSLQFGAEKLAGPFLAQVHLLISSGLAMEALKSSVHQGIASSRRDKIIDVLVASARCQGALLQKKIDEGAEVANASAKAKIMELLDSLTQCLSIMWKVDEDASISGPCTEIVTIMASSLSLILNAPFFSSEQGSFVKQLLELVTKPVLFMCNNPHLSGSSGDGNSLDILKDLPFTDSWMSDDLKKLSVRAYNCAVATNCSHVSGWESEEFQAGHMREMDVPYYFGASVASGQTTGFLNPTQADSLAEQWSILRAVLPHSPAFDFSAQLAALRKTPPFRELAERHEKATGIQCIHLYGEEECLSILLVFSKLSLLVAKTTRDFDERDSLVFTAMSIIVPVSEFCLDQRLWSSDIGRKAAKTLRLKQLQPPAEKKSRDTTQYTNVRKRLPKPPTHGELHQWFTGENHETPLSNVLGIPGSILLTSWKMGTSGPVSPDSVALMNKLDEAMRRLRSCFSEQAAETASLNVAAILVELATLPQCENPFLCLQHAALFASQAKKGGDGADRFKVPLPRRDVCSPSQALAILGRADCLQAIYFYEESAFLCSYVASVCALRRSRQRDDVGWNSRWKVIALMTYNQSVLLRAAANSVFLEHGKKPHTSGTWQTPVIEELKRARADGLTWMSDLQAEGVATHSFNGRARPIARPAPETNGINNHSSQQRKDSGGDKAIAASKETSQGEFPQLPLELDLEFEINDLAEPEPEEGPEIVAV